MWCAQVACGASLLVIFLSLLDGCFANHCTEYYESSYSCTKQTSYTTACGWLWRKRCVKYRSKTGICTKRDSRQVCCAGFTGLGCNTPVCYGRTTCPNGGKCLAPHKCQCATGFKEPRCDDIDECKTHTSGCAQICTNTVGSYKCSCAAGYRLEHDKHNCIDVGHPFREWSRKKTRG